MIRTACHPPQPVAVGRSSAATAWVADLRGRAILDVAAALGLHARGSSLTPCPACGAEQRGGGDRRGPVRVSAERGAWLCSRCEVGGSPVDLAAWVLCGRAPTRGDREVWRVLRGWCGGEVDTPGRLATIPVTPPCPPPGRLSAAEVEAFLRAGLRPADGVARYLEAAEFLGRRGLRPEALGSLARILPDGLAAPWWPGEWSGGWRLAVPVWTGAGVLAGLQARAVNGAAPKDRWPLAHLLTTRPPVSYSGLLFACRRALALLRRRPVEVARLIIVEGLTDFLRSAQEAAALPGVAVLGGTAGSWGALREVAIPVGCRVLVATDPDRVGERYAGQVAEALAPVECRRVDLRRVARCGA